MTRSRPEPLERATALAFEGKLRASAAALDRLADVPATRDARAWLRAYLLAATGAFARGERMARDVLKRTGEPVVRARAAVTLGSILRQTGRHAEARAVESEALALAPTPELAAHLLIGLAADAVGLGDRAAVDRALGKAAAYRSRDPRVGIRLRWVRCERALLVGRPTDARRHARDALAIARRIGARRHVAKSHLFAGAARLEQARSGSSAARAAIVADARSSLRAARSIARRIGASPIERVADELLTASSHGGR